MLNPLNFGEILNLPAGLIGPLVGYYYYGFQLLGILQLLDSILKIQKVKFTTCGLSRIKWSTLFLFLEPLGLTLTLSLMKSVTLP